MVVEFSSPVSTRTQVMMYWVKGRIEKGGSHETTAVLEVMVSTIGLGGSGTPCEREREEGKKWGQGREGEGRKREREEGEEDGEEEGRGMTTCHN